MLDVFSKVKSESLKGLIVWVPMVKGDSALEAAELVAPEKRFLMQDWDSRKIIGEAFARTLDLKCPAWDVYMVYEPGVEWLNENPPKPSFWMHQLGAYSGADPALHLVPSRLQNEVEKRLDVKVGRTLSAVKSSIIAALLVFAAFLPCLAADQEANGVVSHTVDNSEQNFKWTLERMLMATPMPMTGEERQFLSSHPNLDDIRTWSPDAFKKYVDSPLGRRHVAEEYLRWQALRKMLVGQNAAAEKFLNIKPTGTVTPISPAAPKMDQIETQLEKGDSATIFAAMKSCRQDIAELAPRLESYREQAQKKGLSEKLEEALAEETAD